MKNEEELLKNFDNIVGTNKIKRIDRKKFPLILKLYECFKEDMFVETQEYKELKQERQNIENRINSNFSNEQKQLFEEYWDTQNKMQSEIEKQIFLFGYLIRDELENEIKRNALT